MPAGEATSPADLQILLMRRSPGRILPGLWQCVSGSLEDGESVTDGALRELIEETGFGPGQIQGFYDLDQVNQFHEPSYRAIVTSAIFAVRVAAAAEPVLSHEHDSMRWVSPEEALELAVWPAYRESIRRIEENSGGSGARHLVRADDVRGAGAPVGVERPLPRGRGRRRHSIAARSIQSEHAGRQTRIHPSPGGASCTIGAWNRAPVPRVVA